MKFEKKKAAELAPAEAPPLTSPMESSDRMMVLGMTGTGKSKWLKQLLRKWLARGARVVVVDLDDEYSRHAPPERFPGPMRERMTARELAQFPRKLFEAKLSLSVVPSDDTEKSAARCFQLVSRLAKAAGAETRLPVIVVVEEVGYFAQLADAELKALATRYRKYGVACVFVSQRAAQVPKTVRSQTSRLACFQQLEVEDLEALGKKFGSQFAERVSRLPPGVFEGWRTHASTQPIGEEECSASPAS